LFLLLQRDGLFQEQLDLERKPSSAPERVLRGIYHTDGPNIPAAKTVIGAFFYYIVITKYMLHKFIF